MTPPQPIERLGDVRHEHTVEVLRLVNPGIEANRAGGWLAPAAHDDIFIISHVSSSRQLPRIIAVQGCVP